MSSIDARVHGDAIRFNVRVQPRAAKNEFAGVHGSALRIRLAAPPVEGMANEKLIDFLSSSLGIARRDVNIVSGHASRMKLVEVRGVKISEVEDLAG